MAKKRTTLPPELMAEWADERAISEVGADDRSAKWRCRFGHEWTACISNRIKPRGTKCPVCHNANSWKNHADFGLFCAAVETIPLKATFKVSIKCAQCTNIYMQTASLWLAGHRICVSCYRQRGLLNPKYDCLKSSWNDPRPFESVAVSDPSAKWICINKHRWTAKKSERLISNCRLCLFRDRGPLRPEWADSRHIFDVLVADPSAMWRCKNGHTWQARISSRLQGHGCPDCNGNPKKRKTLPEYLKHEWLDSRSIAEISTKEKVSWSCAQGHVWQASTKDRLRGNNCPYCAGNAPVSFRLSQEAPDLLAVGAIASPSTAWNILAACGKTKGKEGAAYRKLLDAQQRGFTAKQAIEQMTKAAEADENDDKDGGDDILLRNGLDPIDNPTTTPTAWTAQRTRDLFAAVSKTERFVVDGAIADETAYQYLVDRLVAKLWADYCEAESVGGDVASIAAIATEQSTSTSRLLSTVAQRWLREHTAIDLHVPRDFRPMRDGKPVVLRMMQRLVAWHLTEGGRQRFGNWSAPGAGKTLGALLTARVAQSQLTLVICPNHVIPTWRREIDRTYNHGHRVRKVVEVQTWSPSSDADFVLINYDRLQGSEAEQAALDFCAAHGSRVGLVVVDECHRVKNDGDIGQGRGGAGSEASARRRVLEALVGALPHTKLLIQTGTPVLTGCAEGVSLVNLIDPTAQETYGFTRKNSFNECMRLHDAITRHGVRFKPLLPTGLAQPTVRRTTKREDAFSWSEEKGVGLAVTAPKPHLAPLVEVDDADAVARLHALHSRRGWSWLDVDEVLLPFKLPAVVEALHPGTIVYTEHVGEGRSMPVVTTLAKAIKAAGFSVAVFDGRAESVKGHDSVAAAEGDCDCKRCRGLADFKAGRVDVLVASRTVGEGVDGLQDVGDRLVVVSPPWHDGAWQQLVGRLHRTGQRRDVEVIVPITWMQTPSGRVSLDLVRLSRINDRGSIADAVLDGALPDHVGGATDLVRAARAELEKLAAK